MVFQSLLYPRYPAPVFLSNFAVENLLAIAHAWAESRREGRLMPFLPARFPQVLPKVPNPKPTAIILASSSATRRTLLANAGVAFSCQSPAVDEAALKAVLAQASAAEMAGVLADEKSLAVSRRAAGTMVIGADQTLEIEGKLLDKPADREEARRQLAILKGRTHALHSAISCSRDGHLLWRHCSSARLQMRAFSDAELDRYLDQAGERVLHSVGAYQIEGPSIQLFQAIEGDYFTILGLPLLPLLDFLRTQGMLQP